MTMSLNERARHALAGVDAALAKGPAAVHEDFAEASRRLVALRDGLIALRRAGDWSAARQDRLDRANAIVSQASAGEFARIGVHAEQLKVARTALEALAAEL